MDVRIEENWKKHLKAEFEKPYFQELTKFVRDAYTTKKIYPSPKDIFRAFDLTPFNEVRVVILGQDPYHGQDKGVAQANGLSFSVHKGLRTPPSLQNIFKEIESDLKRPAKQDTDLARWARQGVLLLNATLTVQAGWAGSHQKKGWEQFTDAAIKALNDEKEGVVFILWGNYARQKGAHIDRTKHLVIESAHPSPFSATNFFGSKPFSKTNAYLKAHGQKEIEW